MTEWTRKKVIWYVLGAFVLMWAWRGLDMDLARLYLFPSALDRLLSDFFPPDFSQWDDLQRALVETIQIALLATFFGFLLSLPLALLSARNLVPAWVSVIGRTFASAIRVLPNLIWAIIMVRLFGFGPFAGIMAMTLYTMGYLAKMQYEVFEGLPRDSIEAVEAMGANRFQVAWHVVLPEAANSLRSQLLFMFEYNVRSSSIIGIVGAGGLGLLLDLYLEFRLYDRIMALVLVLFATVVIIDVLSGVIRRRYLETEQRGPTWRDVLMPWTKQFGKR